jgi:FixJ family two-component response regulator
MVYIVDDDNSVIRAFGIFLKSAGLEYQAFSNVQEFLTGFEPDSRNLLILDLNIPGTNGTDLIKLLDREDIHMPIIVVTAFDEPYARETCNKYGVKAYLRKPVDGEALIDLIKYNYSPSNTQPR